MMQQLPQAKSADGGQQKEESGGTGREDANDDSDGAGRAPREEGAAAQGLAPQQQLLQGEECPTTAQNRRMDQDLLTTRAEDPRFRQETRGFGRRGPDDQHAARRSRTRLWRRFEFCFSEITPCYSACVEGREKRIAKFKYELLLKANTLDISGHLVGQETRVVPVGDSLKQKPVLLREDFVSEDIEGAYREWNFIDGALQREADRLILKRCKSPREAFDHLQKWYDSERE